MPSIWTKLKFRRLLKDYEECEPTNFCTSTTRASKTSQLPCEGHYQINKRAMMALYRSTG